MWPHIHPTDTVPHDGSGKTSTIKTGCELTRNTPWLYNISPNSVLPYESMMNCRDCWGKRQRFSEYFENDCARAQHTHRRQNDSLASVSVGLSLSTHLCFPNSHNTTQNTQSVASLLYQNQLGLLFLHLLHIFLWPTIQFLLLATWLRFLLYPLNSCLKLLPAR